MVSIPRERIQLYLSAPLVNNTWTKARLTDNGFHDTLSEFKKFKVVRIKVVEPMDAVPLEKKKAPKASVDCSDARSDEGSLESWDDET